MVSVGAARKGRTVYSGGSFAPTRGPVSGAGVQGYLKREVAKGNRGVWGGSSQFGRDGQSDTRSGVAKNALANRNKWAGQGEGKPGFNPNNKPPGNGTGGGLKPAQSGQPQPAQGGGGSAAGPVGAPAPPVSSPSVSVNSAGILELPYSPEWGSDVLEGLQESNDELQQLQQQQQAQAAAYAMQKKQAADGYVTQKRTTLNDNASRGTAFSSGYGVAVGNDANNFNNLNNGLDSDNAQANAGFDFSRTSIINSFKDRLRQSSLDYANSLSEDAGTFGYGDPGNPGAMGGGGGIRPNGGRVSGQNRPDYNGGWANYSPPKPPKKPGGKKK